MNKKTPRKVNDPSGTGGFLMSSFENLVSYRSKKLGVECGVLPARLQDRPYQVGFGKSTTIFNK
jgi:hypothetical protein